MLNGCLLQLDSKNRIVFQSSGIIHGKLLPKNGREYQVVIRTDNPDISSLVTEKKLIEQAAKELQKTIGFNIKIWHQFEFKLGNNAIDISIDFSSTDPYFSSDNILGWGGYPNGSLKGRAVLNNKFVWLDGYERTGAELRALGIILPGMDDDVFYQTYSVRQTIKHEVFGHVFGLGHTTDPLDVMNAYYDWSRMMYGKESKQTLVDNYGKANFLKIIVPDSYIKSVMTRREKF